jgi:DnaJ like chaperone protein
MPWWGKGVGAAFGWLAAGPWGAALGVALGNSADRGARPGRRRSPGLLASVGWLNPLFGVMGALARADGRVSEAEVAFAHEFMERMRLDRRQRARAARAFNAGRKPGYRVDPALVRLRAVALGRSDLAEGLLSVLVALAGVDGEPAPEAERLLRKAAMLLGTGTERLDRMRRATPVNVSDNLGEAYAMLGIDRQASDREVKLAYRRLMHRHHPDRLDAGATPETVEIAVRRTVEIRRAYELVRDDREAL